MDGNKFAVLEKVDVAKRMIANNDYAGGRSRLLELHNQFPSFRNLPQMITACDVLCSAELTLSDSEIDWYWVLQLSPAASIYQIRSQHKKLVAALEGIKEEFPRAATALKLVHDAFFILSSPPKRLVFDSKRVTSLSDFEPVVSPASSVDNAGSHSGKSLIQEQDTLGCESSFAKNTDTANVLEAVGEKSSNPIEVDDKEGHHFNESTHEALDVCWPNDGLPPTEMNSISFSLNPMPKSNSQTPEDTLVSAVHPGLSTGMSFFSTNPGFEKDGGLSGIVANSKANLFEVGQIWAVFDDENLPRRYARINAISDSPFRLDIIWLRPVPENKNEKKWCEAGLPVVCGLFNLHGDEESVADYSIFSHWVSYTANPTYDEFRIYPQEDEIWAIYEDWKPFEWVDNPDSRKGCSLEIIQILYLLESDSVLVAKPVKVDGSQNICRIDTEEGPESIEIHESCFYRFSHRLPSYELKDRGKSLAPTVEFEPDLLASNSSSNFPTRKSYQPLPSLPVSNGSLLKAEWTAEDFGSSQVWAIYDGRDQMPRRYAVVNNVMSNRSVNVNLLEPHPMREEDMCLVEENLPLGCGVFRLGVSTVAMQMSKFSHLVNCDRSLKQSFYRIYPKKGEVWAMYRNWNTKWKKQDFEDSRCRIVQITSDFCEQSGVQVASLEEVPGYKTFFQKQLCDGFALNRAVRRTEMLSFSHRVEAFVVPGIQAHGIPECSWHLEPDALPLILSN